MSTEAKTAGGRHLKWFKSSYSNGQHDTDCVEVASDPTAVHVRDSKRTEEPFLSLTPAVWAEFVSYAVER
ncbi:DUF397 domain-containing protein [Streptomyces sp. JJ66]|uniref:DUF397 domain-containing protein n=1 Tax=Streptomyces sp. JJ66 TaxID=2803843 RepID=UPI001C584BC0|nr:DUF397 domain-containing protein [Streptomyces sp. JJ66]MBW1602465.1 DUF397 domain-containing protein [Streptomyces sp. JJ66]